MNSYRYFKNDPKSDTTKKEGKPTVEPARNEMGITGPYWTDLEAIKNGELMLNMQLQESVGVCFGINPLELALLRLNWIMISINYRIS